MLMEPYGVGLDIGSNSIGWVVIDSNSRIKKVKGKTALGARLFKEGETAADRRSFRTTRRRLKRVKWRLRLLREFFDQPISRIDPEFFARRKYAAISPRDSQYNGLAKTLFNDRPDKEFYQKYPTIYHLRENLMTEHHQFDLREIYLAIHHIVKYRGNFLREDPAANYRTVSLELGNLFETLNSYFNQLENNPDLQLNTDDGTLTEVKQILLNDSLSRSDRQKQIVPLMYTVTGITAEQKKQQKTIVSELAKALVGNKAQVNVLTGTSIDKDQKKDWSFEMEDSQDKLPTIETDLNDIGLAIINTVIQLYSGINLAQLIPEGKSFSQSMIDKYNQHHADLELLKAYIHTQTDATRGREIRATYDHYINGVKSKQVTQEDFLKELSKYTKSDVATNTLAAKIEQAISEEQFMPKLRTKQNGSIPYQVHQNELDLIISNQKKYYPWLGEPNPVKIRQNNFPYKLDELIGFRIPYYVGPLITRQEQNKQSNADFSWMVRKADGAITPWNFDEKVDREKSATAFIQRMQTTDTYLIGEDVFPAQSMIYQRFTVLNELNNVKADDCDLTLKQKQRLYEQIFKKKIRVSVKDIQHNLVNAGEFASNPKITGLADPKQFNSTLSTYYDFKKIIPDAIESTDKQADIEEIIVWSTVFEDSHIFAAKLEEVSWLTEEQRHRLSQKRYRGWGQLSKKLLTNFKDENGRSILDGLWETNHNFMQLRSQQAIADQIQAVNQNNLTMADMQDTINDLYTSPQNKKAIREVMLVLADVKAAMHGQEPSWIFVEAARGGGSKGQRTHSRANQIQAIYQGTARDIIDDQVKTELQDKIKAGDNFNDRLVLYFMQNGHDLYTGKKINIDRLPEYDIDHILPQSLVKDDSLDNRVLTLARINREKNDTFASEKFGDQMSGQWRQLHRMGLISKRKLTHLLMRRDEISKYATGFINRQLVETRQVIKLVTELVNSQYPDTKIVSVKANLTHQFRLAFDFPKIREVNNYHHAFDAYLTALIGNYLLKRYPKLERFFVYGKFAKNPIDMKHFNIIRQLKVAKKPIIATDTGEILWDKGTNLTYLDKVYDFKRLLVTHEVYENNGALFDQTIFKASDNGSKKLIPKKSGMDTALYGGYTGRKLAYLSLVRVPTKTECEYRVVGVPTAMVAQLNQLVSQGLSKQQALQQLLAPIFTKLNKKTQTMEIGQYEVVLPEVRFEQVIRDEIKGQIHRFSLGTDTYYHNIQELYLPLKIQRTFRVKRSATKEQVDQNMMLVFDETLKQVNHYFPLYEMNKFKQLLNGAREKYEALDARDVVEKNKVIVGKDGVLTNMFTGLHANASFGDLKNLGVKTAFGMLQVPGGLRLTSQAEIIYQSPTGLFERKVALKDL